MKKITILIAISFLFVLTSCEDTANLTKPSDNKSYFVCVDYLFDANVESVLYIDHNKKIIKVAGKEWENYSQDEQGIFAKEKGDGYENTVYFNFVTGNLQIEMRNYSIKEGSSMFEYNDVKIFSYECRKTESML